MPWTRAGVRLIPEGHSANRSLSAIEPVSATAKRKLENGEQRPAPETYPARAEIPKITGQSRIRTNAWTLYASLLADENRGRNCVALEAVSSRPEIQCRGEGAPVVIPTRFTEDVRADFRARNRLDFRRIVRIGVVMGWPSQSRPLKGSPRDLRGFGSCEHQVRRREPTEPEYVNPFHREVPKP